MQGRGRSNAVSKSEFVAHAVRAVFAGLAQSVDRAVAPHRLRCSSARRRPSGCGAVHISFRFSLGANGIERQGCLLLPLADALALAASMLFLPEPLVAQARTRPAPDESEKEALLELSDTVASSLERALSDFLPEIRVRSLGCQGVRAGVRPSLAYREGDELWVADIQGEIDGFEPFVGYLILPSLAAARRRPAAPTPLEAAR